MNRWRLGMMLALLLIPVAASAEHAHAGRQHATLQTPAVRSLWMNRMKQRHDELEKTIQGIGQHNEWMREQGTPREFQELGKEMEQAGDHLQAMYEILVSIYAGQVQLPNQHTEMDRLQRHLHTMMKELGKAHWRLRIATGH